MVFCTNCQGEDQAYMHIEAAEIQVSYWQKDRHETAYKANNLCANVIRTKGKTDFSYVQINHLFSFIPSLNAILPLIIS